MPDRLLTDPNDVLVVSAMDIWRHLLKTCRSKWSGYDNISGGDRPSPLPDVVRAELLGLASHPPDVFCLCSAVMKRTGVYTEMPSTGLSLPKLLNDSRQTHANVDSPTKVKTPPAQQSHAGLSTQDASADNRIEAKAHLEELLRQKWCRAVNQAALDHLSECGLSSEFKNDLFDCFILADELGKRLGVPSELKYDTVAFEVDELLEPNISGSTLCSDAIDRTKARVLPKLLVPASGWTLRSYSRHLAFIESDEIHPIWCIAPNDSERHQLQVLIVPWPFEVREEQFKMGQQTGGPLRSFEYQPERTGGRAAAMIYRLCREAAKQIGKKKIDLVVVPELSLTREDYCIARDLILPTGAILMSGLGGPTRDGPIENRVVVDIPLGAGYAMHYRQRKHHRWFMSPDQIIRYGLGGALDTEHGCWEEMEIGHRYLHFLAFQESLVATLLVCEDLARHEPMGDLVRSVAPHLVIALLMDGPQMKVRWPARYATALADDPGCSVLTVTCLGMCKRSPKEFGKPNYDRIVAMWRDQKETVELHLDSQADALLLTLSCMPIKERSITKAGMIGDGRSPTLTGILQIRDPAPNSIATYGAIPQATAQFTHFEVSALARLARLADQAHNNLTREEVLTKYWQTIGRLTPHAREVARELVQRGLDRVKGDARHAAVAAIEQWRDALHA